MSAAETVRTRARARRRRRRRAAWWPAGARRRRSSLVALHPAAVGACKTGLPYVYNADENSHFVPRAIGMFGHSLNPDYFINPPAFTYVLHALFTVRWGTDPATIGGAFAADPTTAFALARAASALPGRARRRADRDRRRAAVRGQARRAARGRAAGGRVPAGALRHFALNDAPTLAPLAAALVGIAGIYRTGRTREYVLAGARAGRGDRDQVHGRDRARDAGRGRVRLAGRARPRAQPRVRASR